MSTRTRRLPRPSLMAVSHLVVWFYAALLVLPLYYILVSSLKDNTEIFSSGFALPEKWLFSNYTDAFTFVNLGRGLVNSAYVTIVAGLVVVALTVPAAYGLARSEGRAGRTLERLLALGFLIPGFATLIPTVFLAIGMGLYQKREFLILSYVGGTIPLSVILIAAYMRTIPRELEESAALDGANRLQTLVRIYLPLVGPAVATVMLINFINMWNEYLVALVIAGSSEATRTAQVALPVLVTNVTAQYGLLTAGTVILLVPVYFAYLVLRRRMEEALVSGATKG